MENNFKKEIEDFKRDVNLQRLSFDEERNIKKSVFKEVGISSGFNMFLQPVFRVFVGALGVFLLIGGPIVYASNQSLPGDVLYSVKTGVNERAVGFFVSSDNRDEYNVELAKKRIAELETLKESSTLQKSQVDIVEKHLVNYSKSILEGNSSTQEEDLIEDIVNMDEYLGIIEKYDKIHFSVYQNNGDTAIDSVIKSTEDNISETVDSLVEILDENGTSSVINEYISESKEENLKLDTTENLLLKAEDNNLNEDLFVETLVNNKNEIKIKIEIQKTKANKEGI